MAYEFDWIDAFSDKPFGGNGCAVVHDAEGLTEAQCMAFTRETGLVECTFLFPSDSADVRVRYFMADREIPFAGHPSLATAASLAGRGMIRDGRITFETGAGLVPLEVGEGDTPLITMTQIAPSFGAKVPADLVAAIGGISSDDIIAPPQVVSTGLPFVITVLWDKDALRRLSFNIDAFRSLAAEHPAMEPFWVTMGGETEAGDIFSRLLLAPPLPPEDPFTGSATGAMASYLWANGLIESPRFTAEQGHWLGRPGQAQVEVLGAPDAIEGVRVGGHGALVMSGTLAL